MLTFIQFTYERDVYCVPESLLHKTDDVDDIPNYTTSDDYLRQSCPDYPLQDAHNIIAYKCSSGCFRWVYVSMVRLV